MYISLLPLYSKLCITRTAGDRKKNVRIIRNFELDDVFFEWANEGNVWESCTSYAMIRVIPVRVMRTLLYVGKRFTSAVQFLVSLSRKPCFKCHFSYIHYPLSIYLWRYMTYEYILLSHVIMWSLTHDSRFNKPESVVGSVVPFDVFAGRETMAYEFGKVRKGLFFSSFVSTWIWRDDHLTGWSNWWFDAFFCG